MSRSEYRGESVYGSLQITTDLYKSSVHGSIERSTDLCDQSRDLNGTIPKETGTPTQISIERTTDLCEQSRDLNGTIPKETGTPTQISIERSTDLCERSRDLNGTIPKETGTPTQISADSLRALHHLIQQSRTGQVVSSKDLHLFLSELVPGVDLQQLTESLGPKPDGTDLSEPNQSNESALENLQNSGAGSSVSALVFTTTNQRYPNLYAERGVERKKKYSVSGTRDRGIAETGGESGTERDSESSDESESENSSTSTVLDE